MQKGAVVACFWKKAARHTTPLNCRHLLRRKVLPRAGIQQKALRPDASHSLLTDPVSSPRPHQVAQLPIIGSFVCSPSCLVLETWRVNDGKINLVHELLIGVMSAACRYTSCTFASWVFLPMRHRLITRGKQRTPFMNFGPCSGKDRGKLGASTPMMLVRGLQQMGFQCMHFREVFLPPWQEKQIHQAL